MQKFHSQNTFKRHKMKIEGKMYKDNLELGGQGCQAGSIQQIHHFFQLPSILLFLPLLLLLLDEDGSEC